MSDAKAPAAPARALVIPDSYFQLLAQIESGNRPYVKATTSSASGLYQPVKATWIALGGAWGSDSTKAFGGLRPTVEEQTQRIRALTTQNAAVLQRMGVPITNATLYSAHFLGAGTAAKVLKAPDTARADLLAGQAATDANPSVLRGKTVGEFRAWLAKNTGAKA